MRGRAAKTNPANRFDAQHYEDTDQEAWESVQHDVPTEVLTDPSRTIIASNDSPDVGFAASINPYRGCEHACAYCFARPTHEYLGLSAGLDFETKIFAKHGAAALLRKRLQQKSWIPQVVAISGVTDPYQPTERKLGITRACLEVLAEFRNPVGVLTKSALVTRDVDVLQELAKHHAVSVMLSVTTLDPKLQHRMEPRAARPSKRIAAIEKLATAGIPVGVMVAPVIPGLTDHETPAILRAAADAGATHAGRVVLRLPYGVKDIFEDWLTEHYPERKDKVLNQLRGLRGGGLYDPRFRDRQRGTGNHAAHLEQVFELYRRKYGMTERGPALQTEHFRIPGAADQLDLFGG
jgi:DNA repair photolyase